MARLAIAAVFLAAATLLLSAGLGGSNVTPVDDAVATELPTRNYAFVDKDLISIERLREWVGLQATPPKAPNASYQGNDTCVYANDMECDDPGIGTGACRAGTDYSDCWRIATGAEDNSCRYANDGECDEPRFGFGVCTQGTDRADCGEIAYLRFQDDSCPLAFDGICNDPSIGDGACQARTDRTDCFGRERPMQIVDHFNGYDDRVLLDTGIYPWNAIGWIDLSDGSCTATLIGPDTLLTAAHCIEGEGGTIDARGVFETAFDASGRGLSAQIVAYLIADGRGGKDGDDSDTDWALLRIDRPLGEQVGFLGIRSLEGLSPEQLALLPLYQAGYSWDTGVNLSGNLGCTIIAVETNNILRHDCDTTRGDSGSPLMVRDGDNYLIVANDSAFDILPNQPVENIATRIDAWFGLLADFSAGRIGIEVGGGGKGPGK